MKIALRSMMVLSLFALTLGGFVGCGGEGSGDGSGGGAAAKLGDSSFESPEAVFETAKTAGMGKDYMTLCHCMTPESQEVFAGTMVLGGSIMKNSGAMMAGLAGLGGAAQSEEAKKEMEKLNENLAKIGSLMTKHGVTEEVMKKANPMQMAGGDPVSEMKNLSSCVGDKPAFISEMMLLMEALDDGGPGSKKPSDMFEGELVDLTTDGDTAQAFVVVNRDGGEERDEMFFRKVDGKWLFDLATMMENDMKKRQAPGPGAVAPGAGPAGGQLIPPAGGQAAPGNSQ